MAKAKKLPSGKYRVQVDAGKDISGKRVRRSFTADTKKEAEFLAANFLRNYENGAEVANMTIKAAIDNYIGNRDTGKLLRKHRKFPCRQNHI